MADALVHRGPDAGGIWVDEGTGVALGHRRLSILDLSATGNQPMHCTTGRFVITYNGEIYNFRQLQAELTHAGHAFVGQSDTEVLLAGIVEWGIHAALDRLEGMFAFALWDGRERELHLVRDRLGEKPLYCGWMGGDFVFASEIKALRRHPRFRAEVDSDGLALLMRHSCIPAPYTIYRGVNKVLPGTILTVRPAGGPGSETQYRFWRAERVAEEGVAAIHRRPEREYVAQLEALLKEIIDREMIADVPLGAFLSGGVDSSLVVAIMQMLRSTRVKTFSIGFQEADFDEVRYAEQVARHLGTDHTNLYITPEDARDVIPLLPDIYDEPFADSSQIPTYLVSRLARESVAVSLTGDGADEIFGGYNRYVAGERIWRRFGSMPLALRRLLGGCVRRVSPHVWDRFAATLRRTGLAGDLPRHPADKMAKLADCLRAGSADEMYSFLASYWLDAEQVVAAVGSPPSAQLPASLTPDLPRFAQRMMCADMLGPLTDDILVKVDRAAMAVGLETRAPFLHHRVVELAWRLPMALRIRDGCGKWVLRRMLENHVPRALFDRPKTGFQIPVGHWLRGPLREWGEHLLDERRLSREGYLNARTVRAKWAEHISGKRNWQSQLWIVLMFQAWLDRWA